MALILAAALQLCAQQESRRPSPFPEKNRQRESEASTAAHRASRANRPLRTRSRTAPVTSTPVTNEAASATRGTACFFSAAADRRPADGSVGVNPKEMVAAHATYPLGSRVKVTNLANGKSVVVRIVDRFPDSRRIVSVSEAAARQLGFYEAGTAEVNLGLVQEGTDRP